MRDITCAAPRVVCKGAYMQSFPVQATRHLKHMGLWSNRVKSESATSVLGCAKKVETLVALMTVT